ncbi:hypothetical protein BaRGS_00023714 [Batillaria attramentaria]|uniref:Uncharacterized protein n=1 Tax=Batillaria attramentaria TaxID=370345 RepID=A0ABD0KDP9_9CAEN
MCPNRQGLRSCTCKHVTARLSRHSLPSLSVASCSESRLSFYKHPGTRHGNGVLIQKTTSTQLPKIYGFRMESTSLSSAETARCTPVVRRVLRELFSGRGVNIGRQR